MKRTIVLFLAAAICGSAARAEEAGADAQFSWVPETTAQTAFRAQMGLGLLDGANSGAAITNFFGVDYAFTPDTTLSIGLPLAGTLSDGPDDYGIGNIQLGAKYALPLDRFSVAAGVNISLPTSQGRAAVGTFTRQYTQYVKDQLAFSPYVAVGYVYDRLSLSADLGTDIQFFTTPAAGRGRAEDALFYDLAAALSVHEHFWATMEFGGYTTLSYAGANRTELYAGPGIRYQDPEISVGLHLVAPFRRPARDVIDFMGVLDVRIPF